MSSLTTQQKSDIDKLWTDFWTGGITNPLTVIEQISFLMFARMLDVMETTGERKAERTKKPFKGRFKGKNDPRRWQHFKHVGAAGCSESFAMRCSPTSAISTGARRSASTCPTRSS